MGKNSVRRIKPFLFLTREYSQVNPTLTFVLTTFNQESLIEKVIHSIVNCSSFPSELIVIDDKSEDNTLSRILDMVSDETWENGPIAKISIYGNSSSRFETFCDDFGIRLAKTDFVVLVQSDVILTEAKFDATLIASLRSFPDIMMVSARGTEPLEPVANFFQNSNGSSLGLGTLTLFLTKKRFCKSIHWFISYICVLSYYLESRIARLKKVNFSSSINEVDGLIIHAERPVISDFTRTGKAGYLSAHDATKDSGFGTNATVWLGQTIMRGPIALDRSKYLEVGGFDLGSCFLAFDDHEMALRAFVEFEYRVGFVPIGYASYLSWGSTRQPRSLKQSRIAIFNCLRIANKRKSTYLYSLKNENSIPLPKPEIREYPL